VCHKHWRSLKKIKVQSLSAAFGCMYWLFKLALIGIKNLILSYLWHTALMQSLYNWHILVSDSRILAFRLKIKHVQPWASKMSPVQKTSCSLLNARKGNKFKSFFILWHHAQTTHEPTHTHTHTHTSDIGQREKYKAFSYQTSIDLTFSRS